MSESRQAEIWWAHLPTPAGHRPVLILTRSDKIADRTNVTVAPLTRSIRYLDSEVVLSPEHGLHSVCAVSLDNIATINKVHLERKITKLPKHVMDEVFAAIRFTFAMP